MWHDRIRLEGLRERPKVKIQDSERRKENQMRMRIGAPARSEIFGAFSRHVIFQKRKCRG